MKPSDDEEKTDPRQFVFELPSLKSAAPPVNELSTGEELQAIDLEVLAMRLFVGLRDHVLGPNHPKDCVSCGALVVEAAEKFEELGLPVP